jgi:hypothetical protein
MDGLANSFFPAGRSRRVYPKLSAFAGALGKLREAQKLLSIRTVSQKNIIYSRFIESPFWTLQVPLQIRPVILYKRSDNGRKKHVDVTTKSLIFKLHESAVVASGIAPSTTYGSSQNTDRRALRWRVRQRHLAGERTATGSPPTRSHRRRVVSVELGARTPLSCGRRINAHKHSPSVASLYWRTEVPGIDAISQPPRCRFEASRGDSRCSPAAAFLT